MEHGIGLLDGWKGSLANFYSLPPGPVLPVHSVTLHVPCKVLHSGVILRPHSHRGPLNRQPLPLQVHCTLPPWLPEQPPYSCT